MLMHNVDGVLRPANRRGGSARVSEGQKQQQPTTTMGKQSMAIQILGVLLLLEHCHGSCTICPSGDPITLPEAPLNLEEPVPIETCGDLDGFMLFIEVGSDDCAGVQTLGGLCGCPVPEGACQLCPSPEESLRDPLQGISLTSEIAQQAPTGLGVNCNFVDSFVQSMFTQGSGECTAYQDNYSMQCECQATQQEPVDEDTNEPPAEEEPDDGSDDPIDLGNATVAANPCTLCPLNQQPSQPDKTITIPGVPFDTCGQVATAAPYLDADASECVDGVKLITSFCGCESAPNSCSFCDGTVAPLPDKKLEWFTASVLETYGVSEEAAKVFLQEGVTCGMFESYLSTLQDGSEACFANQLRRDYCGCDTHPKYEVLVWCIRVSAFLSLLSSLGIIHSIVRDPKLRALFYHQLVLAISVFDTISSLAYLSRPMVLPKSQVEYQTFGNDQTCTAQAFFLSLGYGSMFFNFLLAAYFYLIVAQRWREGDFQRVRRPLFTATALLGLSIALAGLPFYEGNILTCYILSPPYAESWLPISFLFFIPMCSCLLGITVFTLLLYRFVYFTDKAASRWRLAAATGNRKGRSQMQEQVFWRCFWYLLAFYLPWPILLVANFVELKESNFAFWVVLSLLSPLQGLLNSLVYHQRGSGAKRTWVQRLRNIFARCIGGIDRRTIHKEDLWSPDTEAKKNEETSPARHLPSGGTSGTSGTDSSGFQVTAAAPESTQSSSKIASEDPQASESMSELILPKIQEENGHPEEVPEQVQDPPARSFSPNPFRQLPTKLTRRFSVDSSKASDQQPVVFEEGHRNDTSEVFHIDGKHPAVDSAVTSTKDKGNDFPSTEENVPSSSDIEGQYEHDKDHGVISVA